MNLPFSSQLLGQFALVAALVIGSGLLFWHRARQRRSNPDSWLRLVERYGTERAPSGTVLANQTMRIGGMVYRDSTTLGIASEGLYIQTWRKAVLIPWAEFRGTSPGRLFWERVPLLSVGEPPVTTIAVPLSVLEQFRRQLPTEAQSTA